MANPFVSVGGPGWSGSGILGFLARQDAEEARRRREELLASIQERLNAQREKGNVGARAWLGLLNEDPSLFATLPSDLFDNLSKTISMGKPIEVAPETTLLDPMSGQVLGRTPPALTPEQKNAMVLFPDNPAAQREFIRTQLAPNLTFHETVEKGRRVLIGTDPKTGQIKVRRDIGANVTVTQVPTELGVPDGTVVVTAGNTTRVITPPRPTQAEQYRAALIARGFKPELADDIANGKVVLVQHPVSGQPSGYNIVTGETISRGDLQKIAQAGALGLLPDVTGQTPPSAPNQDKPTAQAAPQQAPVVTPAPGPAKKPQTAQDAVTHGVGAYSTVIDMLNRVAGQFPGAPGFNEDVARAKTTLRKLNNKVVGALRMSERLPVAEQERIAKMLPNIEGLLESPQRAHVVLDELRQHLAAQAERDEQFAADESNPANLRKEAIERARTFREIVDDIGEMPSDQASGMTFDDMMNQATQGMNGAPQQAQPAAPREFRIDPKVDYNAQIKTVLQLIAAFGQPLTVIDTDGKAKRITPEQARAILSKMMKSNGDGAR